MISKTCKYGVRATIFVATKASENLKVSVKEIAKEVDAPEAFTGKILQILAKNFVITSQKGPNGGFFMDEKQLNQPVINIIKAIDGMALFQECGLGLKQCSAKHPCPMHDQLVSVRDSLYKVYKETTIRQLTTELKQGNTFINNLIA